MIISLTGFMGCGKSSVGKRLSELLCCRFIDLDSEIEQQTGCSVAEIFDRYGETEFRRIEQSVLVDIIEASTPEDKIVLALGGGAVMTPAIAEAVHDASICIYLKASVDELINRLSSETSGRPLLASSDLRSRILELMGKRASTYEGVSHHVIDTDGKTLEETAAKIIELL